MIGELGEAVEWMAAGFAGWRFLLSRKYRETIHLRWAAASQWSILGDVVCGVVGVLFSIGVAVVAVLLVASILH